MKLKPAFVIEWERSGKKRWGRRGLTRYRAFGYVNLDRCPVNCKPTETMNPLLVWDGKTIH